MNHLRNLLIITLILSAGICGQVRAEVSYEELTIDNAWIKAMPPSAEYSAAFLTITNTSEEDVTLVEVKSDLADTVEIHLMKTVNGAMTMRPIKELVIPKGETVALEPGGTHIMLIDLIEPLNAGETADLILVFADGMERTVNAVIRKEVHPDDDHADHDDHDDEHEEDEDAHEGHDHSSH
ncbi:MAG: copper chaperone PCu(A)C [Candidatus Omnitrophota bacterium]